MLQFVLFILWVRVTFKLEFAHVKLQESVHKQMFLTYRVYKCVFSLLPDDYCVSMCVGVCVFVESTTHPSHGVLPDQQDDLKQTINKHGFITSSRLTWLRASASMANSLCCWHKQWFCSTQRRLFGLHFCWGWISLKTMRRLAAFQDSTTISGIENVLTDHFFTHYDCTEGKWVR